ncbi:adenine-specific methyltransferase EcoRI family protein [Corynebacterium glutamicum]
MTTMQDEVDLVITNPPFSLFREFLSWLLHGDVLFSIIGNANVITYLGA